MCFRLFAKTWPERSQRLFSSFSFNIQRVYRLHSSQSYEWPLHKYLLVMAINAVQIIDEEDGGFHRRYSSSSIHDKTSKMALTHAAPRKTLPGYGTSAIVAIDRSIS